MRGLMWFRSDLRVTDNPALDAACGHATRGVLAVFVVCATQWGEHDWSAVKVDFMLRTLRELQASLERLNIPLLVVEADRFDDVPEALLKLARRHECDGLFFNREYEVNEARRDDAVSKLFSRAGLDIRAFTDQVVVPPGVLKTSTGGFYSVFTPFKRTWLARVEEDASLLKMSASPRTVKYRLMIQGSEIPDRVGGFKCMIVNAESLWPAGEREAQRRLRRFLAQHVAAYAEQRDVPALDATSRLSPYLSVGAISTRKCIAAAVEANGGKLHGGERGLDTWISELIWREFYRHVLVGFPRVCMGRAFRRETERMKWRRAEADFATWREGKTGVPIVDAAMRQLRTTGWMHNRLRMISAMFLTKHLLIDWQLGERYFMQQLIDGDLASNNGGWQWSASTGTDAAPYFRIFNPWTQGRKFDPEGLFIREHVAELRNVPSELLHDPDALAECGLFAGQYPRPIVDHDEARQRAIAAFESLKGTGRAARSI